MLKEKVTHEKLISVKFTYWFQVYMFLNRNSLPIYLFWLSCYFFMHYRHFYYYCHISISHRYQCNTLHTPFSVRDKYTGFLTRYNFSIPYLPKRTESIFNMPQEYDFRVLTITKASQQAGDKLPTVYMKSSQVLVHSSDWTIYV